MLNYKSCIAWDELLCLELFFSLNNGKFKLVDRGEKNHE